MQRSNILILITAFAFLCGCAFSKKKIDKKAKAKEYKLVWSDEFDYSGLPDSTKWKYDTEGNSHGWGNQEAQFYTEKRLENAQVKDGVLHIVALKEDFGGKKYTSARLNSIATWEGGKFEIRAKLPAGVGTWPAIWMMPGNWSFKDGNWPDIGEIDIMEHVGHDPGVIHSSAHSKDYQWQKGSQKTGTIKVAEASSQFHTYQLEWTADYLKAFVDDKLFFEYQNENLGVDKWPYNKPFYLILNVAVGGAWGRVKGIDDKSFPQVMEVDYVRVYQKK
ncbi:glycoside hydrolase family 16 protein [Prolixibacteraceae bacterium JC049]|nr:glycoside hydrolase family 16 protein [Prolixibacteraceae bacterium JC049]